MAQTAREELNNLAERYNGLVVIASQLREALETAVGGLRDTHAERRSEKHAALTAEDSIYTMSTEYFPMPPYEVPEVSPDGAKERDAAVQRLIDAGLPPSEAEDYVRHNPRTVSRAAEEVDAHPLG